MRSLEEVLDRTAVHKYSSIQVSAVSAEEPILASDSGSSAQDGGRAACVTSITSTSRVRLFGFDIDGRPADTCTHPETHFDALMPARRRGEIKG